jgi:hypothetical protein
LPPSRAADIAGLHADTESSQKLAEIEALGTGDLLVCRRDRLFGLGRIRNVGATVLLRHFLLKFSELLAKGGALDSDAALDQTLGFLKFANLVFQLALFRGQLVVVGLEPLFFARDLRQLGGGRFVEGTVLGALMRGDLDAVLQLVHAGGKGGDIDGRSGFGRIGLIAPHLSLGLQLLQPCTSCICGLFRQRQFRFERMDEGRFRVISLGDHVVTADANGGHRYGQDRGLKQAGQRNVGNLSPASDQDLPFGENAFPEARKYIDHAPSYAVSRFALPSVRTALLKRPVARAESSRKAHTPFRQHNIPGRRPPIRQRRNLNSYRTARTLPTRFVQGNTPLTPLFVNHRAICTRKSLVPFARSAGGTAPSWFCWGRKTICNKPVTEAIKKRRVCRGLKAHLRSRRVAGSKISPWFLTLVRWSAA